MQKETRITVSVRLKPSELTELKNYASKVGKKPRTFIRESVMSALKQAA